MGLGLSVVLGIVFMCVVSLVEKEDAGNLIFYLLGTLLDESQPETTKFRWALNRKLEILRIVLNCSMNNDTFPGD